MSPPVCGKPPEAGWFVLPGGWELGRPVPASRVEAAEAAWRASTPAVRDGTPGPLIGAALLLLLLLGSAATVLTMRRARRPSGAARTGEGAAPTGEGAAPKGEGAAEGATPTGEGAASTGEGAATAGEGVESGEIADHGGRGTPTFRREGAAGPTPIRTRPREPAGPAIVVPLRRPTPRPGAVPVRLPPHIAAALTRARSGEPDPDGRVGPTPVRPPPAGDEEPTEVPPPPRSAGRGKSWLVDD
jgi:hypothetical protein